MKVKLFAINIVFPILYIYYYKLQIVLTLVTTVLNLIIGKSMYWTGWKCYISSRKLCIYGSFDNIDNNSIISF